MFNAAPMRSPSREVPARVRKTGGGTLHRALAACLTVALACLPRILPACCERRATSPGRVARGFLFDGSLIHAVTLGTNHDRCAPHKLGTRPGR